MEPVPDDSGRNYWVLSAKAQEHGIAPTTRYRGTVPKRSQAGRRRSAKRGPVKQWSECPPAPPAAEQRLSPGVGSDRPAYEHQMQQASAGESQHRHHREPSPEQAAGAEAVGSEDEYSAPSDCSSTRHHSPPAAHLATTTATATTTAATTATATGDTTFTPSVLVVRDPGDGYWYWMPYAQV